MCAMVRIALLIFCFVSHLLAHQRFDNAFQKLNSIDDGRDHHHHPRQADHCAVCGGGGDCCHPRIQCPLIFQSRPARVCHVGRFVGVCCTIPARHLDDDGHKLRTPAFDAEALRSAYDISRDRLSQWVEAEKRANGGVVDKASPTFAHFLSARTGETAKERRLGRGALRNLFAAQSLKNEGVDHRARHLNHVDSPFCPPQPSCPPSPDRFRHISGECNNAVHPSWGASHTAYERILPPNYADGTWSFRRSVRGAPLPSARLVSDLLLTDFDNPDPAHNLMLAQFGQFLVHDITGAVLFTSANGSAIACCSPDGSDFVPRPFQHAACAPILVHSEDKFFATFRVRCMNFVRTQLAPSHDCSLGAARQMNGVTHFADLSTLYGSNEGKLAKLVEGGGRLRTFRDFDRDLPPLTNKPDDCLVQESGTACFASGDDHINLIISLVSLHTLFIRQHNHLAAELQRLNPTWTEELVLLEARRILIAQYQHIVYNEWLPLVIGEATMEEYGLWPQDGGVYSKDYNSDVNPSVTSETAAAALRFGHSTIDNKIKIKSTKRTVEEISIPEVMFQPSRVRLREFHDRLLTGLAHQPMQRSDPFVCESLTRYMFHAGQPFGLDLASINVQRARDHGVRSYNDYVHLIAGKPIDGFHQFPDKTAQRLSSVYSSVDDIDLWVGGLMEPPLDGAVVGNTFAHILADQFSRLRRGDRYFYEHGPDVNPGAFTRDQLAEIKKSSMARLVCDHSDGFELREFAPRAFLLPTVPGNEPVPCNSPLIPILDLNKFRGL